MKKFQPRAMGWFHFLVCIWLPPIRFDDTNGHDHFASATGSSPLAKARAKGRISLRICSAVPRTVCIEHTDVAHQKKFKLCSQAAWPSSSSASASASPSASASLCIWVLVYLYLCVWSLVPHDSLYVHVCSTSSDFDSIVSLWNRSMRSLSLVEQKRQP